MENLETHPINLDLNNWRNATFQSTMEVLKWEWTVDEKGEDADTPDNLKNYNTQIETSNIDPRDFPDGYIDDVKQWKSADCRLISELEALSQSKWWRNIIKNAIKKHWNNNYKVTLHGENWDFVHIITKEDIEMAQNDPYYSSGDLDVLIMELATEVYKKTLWKTLDVLLSNDDDMFKLLTGENTEVVKSGFLGSKQEMKNTINKFKQNPDKYAMCCSLFISGGSNIDHLCTISRFETDENWISYVIMKNPYNTAIEIKLTEDKFINNISWIYYIENENYVDNNRKIISDGQIWHVNFAEKGTDKWALPTIKAIWNENPNIISDSIKKNSNGDLEITLKWVNKKYIITSAEIEKAKDSGKYSRWDVDVIALEIAIERFWQREYWPNDTSSKTLQTETFNGISLSKMPDSTIIYILTGQSNMHVGVNGKNSYIITNTPYFKDMPPEPIKTVRLTPDADNKEESKITKILRKARGQQK